MAAITICSDFAAQENKVCATEEWRSQKDKIESDKCQNITESYGHIIHHKYKQTNIDRAPTMCRGLC